MKAKLFVKDIDFPLRLHGLMEQDIRKIAQKVSNAFGGEIIVSIINGRNQSYHRFTPEAVTKE